jgi:hypothetical protein
MHLSTVKSREAIKYYRKRYAPKERVFAKIRITDEASAAVAAEEILFPIFGKDEIREERPYTVGYADGYWIVYGYLPRQNERGNILGAREVISICTSEIRPSAHWQLTTS